MSKAAKEAAKRNLALKIAGRGAYAQDLNEKGQFTSVETMIDYAQQVDKVDRQMWHAEKWANTQPTPEAQAFSKKTYQSVYLGFMKPFISTILPGAENAGEEYDLNSRLTNLPIGQRIVTDKDAVAQIVADAKKAGEIYNLYFPTHEDKSDVLKFVANTYEAVAPSVMKLAIKVMGKNDADAKGELGKVGGTVKYLTSDVFNAYVDKIETDPSATIVTGKQVRNKDGALITSWDEIDGSSVHVDIYPDEVIEARNESLVRNDLNISFPASNYNLGTWVTDPLHGLRLGVPVATKPHNETPDCAAAFTAVAMTAVFEKLLEKGATKQEAQFVRDHFMPVVMGRVGLEEHGDAFRFVGGTRGARALLKNRQNSEHLSDEVKAKYILEADGTNPVLIDNTKSIEQIAALTEMYFKRGKGVGGQTCTRAGAVGLQDGLAYDTYRDAYLAKITAFDEEIKNTPWNGGHDLDVKVGPTAMKPEELKADLADVRAKFGAENVYGGSIIHEMPANTVMTPAVVEVTPENMDKFEEMLAEGKEKFYPIQFIFKVPTAENGTSVDVAEFSRLMNVRSGRLTSAIHSNDPAVAAFYAKNVLEGSVNLDNDTKGTSDNTSVGGHLCHIEGIKNNGPTGTPAQTLHFYKGGVQNPITSIFEGNADPEFQKQRLWELGVRLEGTPPVVSAPAPA